MAIKSFAPFAEQKIKFAKKIARKEKVMRTKLILLIISNTRDPEIGKGCIKDITSIYQMFKKLSAGMDFNFLDLVIQGDDYSKKNIREAIEILTPGSNDIVVTYYSGHGFSYEKDKAKRYPQVDLRSHPASSKIAVINANTENLADLFRAVKARGARLNIVIGDCCNSLIAFKRQFTGGDSAIKKEKKPPVLINKETCEALFCDYTASILVASADKGQYAVSDDDLGSIFTYNFARNLKILMNKTVKKEEGLPWEKLLKETTERTHEISKTYDIGNGVPGDQMAIYKVEFRENLY